MAKKLETQKVPSSALHFEDTGNSFAKTNEAGGFEMLAYSGGVIKGHWYWGDLIINLAGMQFNKTKYPILMQHDISRKIGFISKPRPVDNQLAFNDITFVETKFKDEFVKLSKQGFPYEASIAAKPTSIIRLEEGAKLEVNGRKVKGPMTVWNESVFRESSVVVFGADSNTKSKAFAEGEAFEEFSVEVVAAPSSCDEESIDGSSNQLEGGKPIMNLGELQEKHPELFAEMSKSIRKEVEVEFSDKEKKLTQENSQLSAKVDTLSETVETQGKSILQFQKNEVIRTEKEIKAQASSIWTSKLSDSTVPTNLHDKVRVMVGHTSFMKEGVFDVETFSSAVVAEIKDWEDKVQSNVSVEGFGVSRKQTSTDSLTADADDEAWAKEMKSFVSSAN